MDIAPEMNQHRAGAFERIAGEKIIENDNSLEMR